MNRRRWFAGRERAQAVIRRAAMETLEARQFLHAGHAHLSLKVDFQPATESPVSGYVADTGLTYGDRGDGLSYGWSKSHTDTARDRDSSQSPDERYDTFITMKSNATWNIAVPNGTYEVRLGAGDALSWVNRYYAIKVEGTLAVDFQPTKAERFVDGAVVVTVSDGKLTLSGGDGARMNNLGFIDIATAGDGPAPTEPPAAPSGADAEAISASQVRLRWADNADNEAGYRVYRKTGLDGTWALAGEVFANEIEYLDNGLSPSTQYVYRVVAFNDAGSSDYSNEDDATTRESNPGGTTISWQRVADGPANRAEAQGGVVNGKHYVLGGLYVANGDILGTTRCDVYDPATNQWTRLNDAPDKITHAATVIIGDTLWLIGGFYGDDGPASKRVWKYNTTDDTWTRGPDLPYMRGGGGAGRVGDSIYFFGGNGYDRTWSSGSTWALDLNNLSAGWIARASMPNPRNHMAGAAVNGYLYALGGQHGQSQTQVAQRDIHRYDPLANVWVKVAEFPTVRSHINAATVVWNDRILVVGGETGHDTQIRNVTVFDPATNTTYEMTPLPAPRSTNVVGILPDGRFISAAGSVPLPDKATFIGSVS